MSPSSQHICAHPPCQCPVKQEGQYCSEACRGAVDTDGPCPCGHEDCTASQDDD